MLPIPRLDDRTFEQMIREARDMIPGLFPEWTDENAHDPGITLLEMLAWHLEVQQYRLDQLTDSHERKFLKLLGDAPRDRQPAQASVVISGSAGRRRLRPGTVLRAGETPYETAKPLTVVPGEGLRLEIVTGSGIREIAAGDDSGHAPFYPFGQDGEAGSKFRLLFKEPLPANEPLSVWIDLVDDDIAVQRIPPVYPAFVPSATVEWMYESETGDGGIAWLPLEPESDETHHLHQSGSIRFRLPAASARLAVRMTGGAYDRVPCIRRLCLNEVPVVQGLTHGVVETFDCSGEPDLRLTPSHALFSSGVIGVQTLTPSGGWIDWEEAEEWPQGPQQVYRVQLEEGECRVVFGDGLNGAIPPEGEGTIRLIAISQAMYGRTYVGSGTGTSGQRVTLPIAPVLPDHLLVQVGRLEDDGRSLVWYDWRRTADFDRSAPDDPHFVFEDANGLLAFPDSARGAVPPASAIPNIRLIALREGGGLHGNVKEGQIRSADGLEDEDGLRLTNYRPAAGGTEPETTGEALRRVQRSVLEPDCGVTVEDVERLIGRIPGISAARVKAIPGYRPGLRNYPEERTLGDVTIVVVPANGRAKPKPSAGFVQTVRNHLEPYRLLTTKYHIVPPEFVTVTVRAIVVVDPWYDGEERRLNDAIDRLFAVWAFGRPVYKSDVYDAIHRVPGVLYVQEVWLTADGKDVVKEEGGDIRIPPTALVVSGSHEIEFISSKR